MFRLLCAFVGLSIVAATSFSEDAKKSVAAVALLSKGHITGNADARNERPDKGQEIDCLVPLAICKGNSWIWVGATCGVKDEIGEGVKSLEGVDFFTLEPAQKHIRASTPLIVYHLADAHVPALRVNAVKEKKPAAISKIRIFYPQKGSFYSIATTSPTASFVKPDEVKPPKESEILILADKKLDEMQDDVQKGENEYIKNIFAHENKLTSIVTEANAFLLGNGTKVTWVVVERPYKGRDPKDPTKGNGTYTGLLEQEANGNWREIWHHTCPWTEPDCTWCQRYHLLQVTDINNDDSPEYIMEDSLFEGTLWTILLPKGDKLESLGELVESL